MAAAGRGICAATAQVTVWRHHEWVHTAVVDIPVLNLGNTRCRLGSGMAVRRTLPGFNNFDNAIQSTDDKECCSYNGDEQNNNTPNDATNLGRREPAAAA